jgi:hypothetical protein
MKIVKPMHLLVAPLACSPAAAQVHMGIEASEFYDTAGRRWSANLRRRKSARSSQLGECVGA